MSEGETDKAQEKLERRKVSKGDQQAEKETEERGERRTIYIDKRKVHVTSNQPPSTTESC